MLEPGVVVLATSLLLDVIACVVFIKRDVPRRFPLCSSATLVYMSTLRLSWASKDRAPQSYYISGNGTITVVYMRFGKFEHRTQVPSRAIRAGEVPYIGG